MQVSAKLLKARFLRLFIFLLVIAAIPVFSSISGAEVRIEEKVGKLLVNEFDPEKIMVQATGGGSFLYAKVTGIVIEGVRIESVSLYAMMKEPPLNIKEDDEDHKYKLADLIHYSRGEVVLLEKDFTDYTSKEIKDIKGFKNLECDFSKNGIRVSGHTTRPSSLHSTSGWKSSLNLLLMTGDSTLQRRHFLLPGSSSPTTLQNNLSTI